MTQALITVNGSPGSNDDLPINTLAQLDNTNTGGEVSYTWLLASQPPGVVDALSSTAIQNPTITSQKEGSYRVTLVVNTGLADEARDTVVLGIRQLKTRVRVPAPGEINEVDAAQGHAAATNEILRLVDSIRADPGILVVELGENVVASDIVKFTGISILKNGLPGEERVPKVTKAPATAASITTEELGIVIGPVEVGGALTTGKLVYVRVFGLLTGQTVAGAADEAAAYVSDTATLSSTVGTNTRRCGKFVDVTGSVSVYFKG